MSNGEFQATVSDGRVDATTQKISGPACTINGELFVWPVTLDRLKAAVVLALQSR
jgi:hypothetical protein